VPLDLLLKFRDYIEIHSGISIEESKYDALRISLHSRATRHHFQSYEEYFEFLRANEEEFKQLISLIAVNETYFFRYPEQFKILREYVIPEIIKQQAKRLYKCLKIWSAGCSSGEEAYSIAICVKETIPDLKNWDIHILGTDVSLHALEKATKGRYGRNSFRILDEDTKNKYFNCVGEETWEIKPEIKKLVNFTYHNLIKEPYPLAFMELWDIIFCRNVTIYFRPESTKRVVTNLYKSLKPGGFLFTGHTETLYHINPGFEVIRFGDAYIFRKPFEESQKKTEKTTHIKHKPKDDLYKKASEKGTFTGTKDKFEQKMVKEPKLAESYDLVKKLTSNLSLKKEAKAGLLDTFKKLAYEFLNAEKLAEAETYINKYLELEKLDPEIHYLYGLLKRKQKDIDAAIACFKKAIYLDSNHHLSLIELANTFLEKEDYSNARKYYQQALNSLNFYQKIDDSKSEDHELLARVCEMMLEDIDHREAEGR
jgi:chemotaxis protein methyltransferase CheR